MSKCQLVQVVYHLVFLVSAGGGAEYYIRRAETVVRQEQAIISQAQDAVKTAQQILTKLDEVENQCKKLSSTPKWGVR